VPSRISNSPGSTSRDADLQKVILTVTD